MPSSLLSKSESATMGLTFAACLGGFVSTYNLVCLTQMAPLLKLKRNLSQDELVWQLTIATSIFNIGGIFGPIIYIKLARFLSRYAIPQLFISIDCFCIFLTLMMLYQLSFPVLILLRFLMGILVGISITLIPTFIKNISPPQFAGKMGTLNQLLQTSGVLGSSLLGFLIIKPQIHDEINWRIFLGFPIIPLILRIILLIFVFPYKEKKQIKNNKFYDEARNMNEKCRNIKQAKQQSQNKKEKSEVFTLEKKNEKTYKIRLIIGLVLMASNQITGIGAIIFYLKQFLYKIIEPNPQNIYIIQAIMCLLSLAQIVSTYLSTRRVEREGRRVLIIQGQASIIKILLAIFVIGSTREYISSPLLDSALVILIFGHIIAHNRGLGTICIVYCADILQNLSWMIVALKVCSSSISLTSQHMIQYLGISNMFLLFASLSFSAHLFLRKWLVQTKNLGKSEICEKLYARMQQSKIGQRKGQ